MQQRRSVRLHFILNLIIAMLIMLACTSFAWFTDKASVDNVVLNFGKIELDVGEAGIKTGMKLVVAREDGSDGDSTMMPGDTVTVKMSVKLKDDSQPAYYLIWLNDNDLFNCDKYLFFSSNGNTYATDGTTTNQVNANGTLGTNTISNIVGKISRNQIHNIEFTLNMELNLSSQSSSNTVYAAKTDSTLSETQVYDSKNLTCKIYAIQQANITEPEAFAELSQEAVKEEGKSATFVKGAVSLSDYTTVGFYKTSGLPSTVSLNSSLTSTYDSAVTNTAEKGMIKVYTSSDGKEIAFACDYKIMAPADCSSMFEENRTVTTINFDNFNTSNTTTMASMFAGCDSLTTLDVSEFDTSNVTNMASMFGESDDIRCAVTSLDLSNWNTSKVTNMSSMFKRSFNLISLNLTGWDTSKVTGMGYMFYNCSNLTELDLSSWDTSSVKSMFYMFYSCYGLTELNLSGWDTSKVTDMERMFRGCKLLTELNVSSFNTSSVTDMYGMFEYCTGLTSITFGEKFNTSKVTNMNFMFGNCSSLTELDLSSFSLGLTSNAINFLYDTNLTKIVLPSTWGSYNIQVYNNYALYDLDTSMETAVVPASTTTNITSDYAGKTLEVLPTIFPTTWKTELTNTTNYMTTSVSYSTLTQIDFETTAPTGYSKIGTLSTGIEVYQNTSSTGKIAFVSADTIYAPVDSSRLFREVLSLTTINFDNFNTSKVTNMSYMFAGDTYDVNYMSLTSLDLSSWDTSNVENMANMFEACSSLTELDLSGWDTSKVENMSWMFLYCVSLTELDLSHFDTSKVTYMNKMFSRCGSLTELNVSNFNTSKVENMAEMFCGCSKLTELNVNHFDTSKVTNMMAMFALCSTLTELDLSSWDTSELTTTYGVVSEKGYYGLFSACSALTSITFGEKFNTSKVTNMNFMFGNCSSLTELDLSSFSLGLTSNAINFLYNTNITKIVLPSTWGSYNIQVYNNYALYDLDTSMETAVVPASTTTNITSDYAGKTLVAID